MIFIMGFLFHFGTYLLSKLFLFKHDLEVIKILILSLRISEIIQVSM